MSVKDVRAVGRSRDLRELVELSSLDKLTLGKVACSGLHNNYRTHRFVLTAFLTMPLVGQTSERGEIQLYGPSLLCDARLSLETIPRRQPSRLSVSQPPFKFHFDPSKFGILL